MPGAMMRRLLSLLLLAVIAVQAWPDGAATFQSRSGSAFSASTVEVALVPAGRSEFGKASPQQALPPPTYPPQIVTIVAAEAIALLILPGLDRTDPAPDQAPSRNQGPRPPPSV